MARRFAGGAGATYISLVAGGLPASFEGLPAGPSGPPAACQKGSVYPWITRISATWYGTTIVTVRKGGKVVVAGDGQVSVGQTVIKHNAKKVRPLGKGRHGDRRLCRRHRRCLHAVRAAGSQARAVPNQLTRACVELAKDWRTDRYLRRLEAMMIVARQDDDAVLTGTGDVLEPEGGVAGIGSGGNYALAAARALADTDMDAETIARKAMAIAADICIYTNTNVTLEQLASEAA